MRVGLMHMRKSALTLVAGIAADSFMTLIVECSLTLSLCLPLANEMFVSSRQSPNPMAGLRQQRRVAAVMIVVFILLFCFWYFNVPITAAIRSHDQIQSESAKRCSTRLQSKDIKQYQHNALALSHVSYNVVFAHLSFCQCR